MLNIINGFVFIIITTDFEPPDFPVIGDYTLKYLSITFCKVHEDKLSGNGSSIFLYR